MAYDAGEWVADASKSVAAAAPGVAEDVADLSRRGGVWIAEKSISAVEAAPGFAEDVVDLSKRGGRWAVEAGKTAAESMPSESAPTRAERDARRWWRARCFLAETDLLLNVISETVSCGSDA